MKYKKPIISSLLVASCLVILAAYFYEDQRLNIVIIIADDLGWNDVGVYGNTFVRTPNIDALAADGLRFNNAFLATASCSASRASILTGRYPHSNGLKHLHQALPEEEVTLAEILHDEGYYTASVGKWHIGKHAKKGFDFVYDDAGKNSDSGSEQWLQSLKNRPNKQPFFFWLASRDPHRPYRDSADLPEKYLTDEIVVPDHLYDGPATRQELVGYYREVSRFDSYIGSVIEELNRQQVLSNTLVIVMSDNGRPFARAKPLLYDDGIKTPFILFGPDSVLSAGIRHQLISMVDLVPTILELLNIAIPKNVQGISFLSMLKNPEKLTRKLVYAERNWHGSNAHERAVRSHDFLYKENQFPLSGDCYSNGYSSTYHFAELNKSYKNGMQKNLTTCFADKRAAVELFAVDVNGGKSANLAQDPLYKDELNRLSSALEYWRSNTNDTDYEHYERP